MSTWLGRQTRFVITTAFPPCLKRIDWRPLYRAAILETTKRVLAQRVSEAEAAVTARRREIFSADGTPEEEEKEALEDALYALHAFITARQYGEELRDSVAGVGPEQLQPFQTVDTATINLGRQK